MKLTPVIALLISISLFISYSCSEDNGGNNDNDNNNDTIAVLETFYFEHEGGQRSYSIYLPEQLSSNAPLIFVLHGLYQTKSDAYAFGFDQIADTAGFAVCYPQGKASSRGISHWNARLKGDFTTVDDIGFLSELALFLQQEHDLDPDRTFCCGFSNGGYMSYTLACEAPDIFKAIAPVAGSMSEYTWSNCKPANPVPVLHFHGRNDTDVPITGDTHAPGFGGEPPLVYIIDYWVNLNECSTCDTVQINANTTAYYHRNGIDGNEVWYYSINNYGHEWPQSGDISGISPSELIWEFFSKY